MKKSKHGGKRPGSGRKAKEDPLIQITIAIPKSCLDFYVDKKSAKIKAQDFLISFANSK